MATIAPNLSEKKKKINIDENDGCVYFRFQLEKEMKIGKRSEEKRILDKWYNGSLKIS